MSKFSDASGLAWPFEFDCFLLDRVEKEANVDLADLSAGGLFAVERDVKALGRVLAVVCSEKMKERGTSPEDFIKMIRKNAITRAREAVLEALADFFPASEWSEMQLNSEKRKNQPQMTPEELQMAVAFTKMDPEAQRGIMEIVQEEKANAGNSPSSPEDESAPDPDATPPTPVESSQESAESAPEDSPSGTSG